MLGLGEKIDEVMEVLHDLYEAGCDLITIGQSLQPSQFHPPIDRYVSPEVFYELRDIALDIGFKDVASGPLIRSSYHADKQVQKLLAIDNK